MEKTSAKLVKRNNARVMKWREMLNNGINKDPETLTRRVRKGIPPSIRIKVWPELMKLSHNSTHKEPKLNIPVSKLSQKVISSNQLRYSTILQKDSYDVYDIQLDIPRTFSFESQEILKDSLFNVLKALSIEFPEIGYCQGMNFLSMRLLEILDDETVFKLMCFLLRKFQAIYDNFRNPGFVDRQNYVFAEMLHKLLPKIAKRLSEQGIEPVMYTTSWFMTLFSKSLQPEKFYRFFECFLLEGYPLLYRTAIGLIKMKEKEILSNPLEANLILVSDMSFYEQFENDDFVSRAIFGVEDQKLFLEKNILARENEYNLQNKQAVLKLEENVKKSYEKKVDEPRRVLEWNISDFEKSEFAYIKFQKDSKQPSQRKLH